MEALLQILSMLSKGKKISPSSFEVLTRVISTSVLLVYSRKLRKKSVYVELHEQLNVS